MLLPWLDRCLLLPFFVRILTLFLEKDGKPSAAPR